MKSRKNKFKTFLENMFSPKSPLDFIGFVIFSYIISLFTAGNFIGFIAVIIITLIWILVIKEPPLNPDDLKINIQPAKPKGAVGLILLLSPYHNKDLNLSKQDIKELIKYIERTPVEELTRQNFEAISLLASNSNIRPQIEAVEYHVNLQTLEQVWLISTSSYEKDNRQVEGSEITAKILEKYLQFKYGQKLKIEREEYVTEDGNYGKLYYLVDTIFKNSKYKEDEIIADITGGKKMMSVSLAMACVAPKRKMQYMDSERDWQGNPIKSGNMQPVEIDVDPIFYQGKESS